MQTTCAHKNQLNGHIWEFFKLFLTEIHILCIFSRAIGIRSYFANEALEMSYERSCNMRVFEARGPSRL